MRRFVRPHVPEEELHAYADNQLSGGQRTEISEHLMECLICRAQHAEVRELRMRTSEILAIALPKIPVALQATEPAAATSPRATASIEWRRALAAAAVIVTIVGAWITRPDTTRTAARAALANVFVSPALFASSAPPPGVATDARAQELARRSTITPRVIAGTPAPVRMHRSPAPADPMADFSPAAGWDAVSWEDAVRASNGALSHLGGLPITAVRIDRAVSKDERPTVVVRHRLPDNRSAWVIEGTEAGLASVQTQLKAIGLALSTPVRTRPDYVGSSENPQRVTRLAMVAAYLEQSDVERLVERLK